MASLGRETMCDDVTTGFVVKYLRVRTSTNLDSPVLYSNSWLHFGDLPFVMILASLRHSIIRCMVLSCTAVRQI
jgi:hypothetical protein